MISTLRKWYDVVVVQPPNNIVREARWAALLFIVIPHLIRSAPRWVYEKMGG